MALRLDLNDIDEVLRQRGAVVDAHEYLRRQREQQQQQVGISARRCSDASDTSTAVSHFSVLIDVLRQAIREDRQQASPSRDCCCSLDAIDGELQMSMRVDDSAGSTAAFG